MNDYEPKLSRRETLTWFGAMASGLALTPAVSAVAALKEQTGPHAVWVEVDVKAVGGTGYGTDPNLIAPSKVVWPRVLNSAQLETTAQLADIIVPREGSIPPASEVGVVDLIDEWVSAPYDRQRSDRVLFESGLAWLDEEGQLRFGQNFVDLSSDQQIAIVEDIAFPEKGVAEVLVKPSGFFTRFRALSVGAFYTSPAGAEDLGYIGNIPIAGDYPGPSKEALQHLDELLRNLGLSE